MSTVIDARERFARLGPATASVVTPPAATPPAVTARDGHGDCHGLDLALVVERCDRDPAFLSALRARFERDPHAPDGRPIVPPILGSATPSAPSASAPVLRGSEHADRSHALADLVVSALPPKGQAYSATFTAPSSDPVTFAAMLSTFLSDGIASDEVLAYAITTGRRDHEHVHAHGLLVVRSTRALAPLREAWARKIGSSIPSKALGATPITGWADFPQGLPHDVPRPARQGGREASDRRRDCLHTGARSRGHDRWLSRVALLAGRAVAPSRHVRAS